MPGVEYVLVLGSINVEEETFGNMRIEPRDTGIRNVLQDS